MKTNKFDLLVAVYITCIMLAELMGGKTFPLVKIGSFMLNASVAIFVFPLVFTINDIVTEVYGKERARSIVRSGIAAIVLMLIFSVVAVSLPPSARFEKTNPAYVQVFSTSIRIAAASLTAFIIAEYTDIFIFSKIREKLGKKKLWLRNNISNFASQFLDTVIFMTLAFYALDRSLPDNFTFLAGLIIPYWLLKCTMSIIETPIAYVGVKWLKGDKK